MDETKRTLDSKCFVCGEERNIEIFCTSHSFSYDNDDSRFTDEVCWEVCEDCIKDLEYSTAMKNGR